MPLVVYPRPKSAILWIRGTVAGQFVRESAQTSCPKQAEAYRAKREAELWQGSVYGIKAVATFGRAVQSFLLATSRSDRDKARLAALVAHLGEDRKLSDIGQESLDGAYRAILRDGADASAGAKLRGVLAPLRAVMEHAAVRKWCDRPAFEAPRIGKAPTHYLKPEEATRLVLMASTHLRPLLVFLLGTGCRMAEALELEWDRVDLRGARAVVRQKQGNDRQCDLPPAGVAALAALPHREGAVFRPDKRGERAAPAGEWQGYADFGRETGGQVKKAWATACRKARLPGHWREWTDKRGRRLRQWQPQHTPHDLRHTWATWHYARRKDPFLLQRDGGWSTSAMVERYTKLMPEAYRAEAEAWLERTDFASAAAGD